MSSFVAAVKSFFGRLFGTAEKDMKDEINFLKVRIANLEANFKQHIGNAGVEVKKAISKVKGL